MRFNPDLNAFLLSVPMEGEPVEVPLELLPQVPNVVEFKSVRHSQESDVDGSSTAVSAAIDLMSLSEFSEKWVFMHGMLGAGIAARTGAECDLTPPATSETGQKACDAVYRTIQKSPAVARFLLSNEAGFWADMAAVGMHVFGCVQIVKASALEGAAARSELETDAA